MPRPTDISIQYTAALNEHLATGTPDVDYRGFDVIGGRSYDKIVNVQTWRNHSTNAMESTPKSVHAFIDRANGDLIKAGTWSSPQKNSAGMPAVRFHLTSSEEARKVAFEKADLLGEYLYAK